jgi:hypothetical protein
MEALTYYCMRTYAARVWGLQLLLCELLTDKCMRTSGASVWGPMDLDEHSMSFCDAYKSMFWVTSVRMADVNKLWCNTRFLPRHWNEWCVTVECTLTIGGECTLTNPPFKTCSLWFYTSRTTECSALLWLFFWLIYYRGIYKKGCRCGVSLGIRLFLFLFSFVPPLENYTLFS